MKYIQCSVIVSSLSYIYKTLAPHHNKTIGVNDLIVLHVIVTDRIEENAI